MPLRRRPARHRYESLLAVVLALCGASVAAAQPVEPPTCRVVRLADVGWTDVTATTSVVSHVLRDLGYEPRVTLLSVPVTFESLRNGDVDVFLGNWMPSQRAMIAPYLADASIATVRPNLSGARYTLAVPAYLHDAGLRDFGDIARFRDELDSRIHGIEAGNEANEILHGLIGSNTLGLGGFRLVESSEQGMLAQVERAVRARQPIVFLGWAPHPMNRRFEMRYLTGGDAWFGPDFGGATVHTVTRGDYLRACPNVGRLLGNVAFTVEDETSLMEAILVRGMPPAAAAAAWVAANPGRTAAWLRGVARADGTPLGPAVPAAGSAPRETSGFETALHRYKLPVGEWATRAVEYARGHAAGAFSLTSSLLEGLVRVVDVGLRALPPALLIAMVAGLAWLRRRSIAFTLFVVVALLFIVNLGYLSATTETVTLVVVAAALATAIGVPVGIVAARRPALGAWLRPLLDLMQTLPTFVYLTPTLVLFGLGVVPGLVATIIFAMPAPIRLTQIGIASVPRPLVEAGLAFGATPWQLLWKVELPNARATIMAGVTQCIMLSLSMVVIAALVGAGGLGVPIVRALNTVQVGTGIEAGLAIVLVAIILDRLARPRLRPERG